MAVIDELRARYPHLKDYSDDELSNTIFEKVVKERGYDRTEFDDKFLGTKESFVKDSAVSLGQGIANLGAGILATPQFVSDKFAQGIRAVLPDAILPKQREAKGFMAQAQQAGLGLKGLSDSVGKQLHTDQFNRVEENVRPKFDVDAGSLENWKNGAVWQEAKGAAGFYADNPFHAWNDLVKSAPSIAVSVGAAKLGAAGLSGSAATKAATGAGVATGAMLEGGDSGLEAMQRVQEMKPEQLKALSEPYNKLINEGATHEQAVNVIARNAGADAFAVAAAISVVASKLTGSGKLEADVATGNLNKGFVSSVGGGAVKEGAQEAVESGGSATASNYGVYDNADKSQRIGQGVVGAAVQGSMVGTGMGSGLGFIGYATQKPQPKQAQANQPLTEKQLWGYEPKPDARPDISGSDGTDLLGGNASASQQQPATNQTKTANQQEQSSLDAGLTQAIQNAQVASVQNKQAVAQAMQSPEVLQANASLDRMMPQDQAVQELAASGAPVIEITPPESKSGQIGQVSGQQEQSFDIANTLNSAIDTQNKVQIDSAYRQREAQAQLKKDLDYTEAQLQAVDDEYAAIKALQGKSPVTNTALHDQLTKALSEVELKRLVHAENRQRIMESGNPKLVEAGAQEMQGVATPELPVAINESLQPQEQIKLPPNYADERLSDTNYRNALGAVVADSTEGGNISLVPKAGTGYIGGDGKIQNQELTRTKSTNHAVTQALISNGYKVSEVKAALGAALEGKPLGKRYQGIVTKALDYAKDDAANISQQEADYQARLTADIAPQALGYGGAVNAPFSPDNAQSVTLNDQAQPRGADGGVMFSRSKNNTIDTDYMDAVNRGDMEAAKRMVNDYAASRDYIDDAKDTRMMHKAPTNNGENAPLHDLAGLYGDDIYSRNAYQYFDDGGSASRESIRIMQQLKGNPDAMVTAYRAVPKDVKAAGLRVGDWVTLSRKYAEDHGSGMPDGYKVITEQVPAKFLFSDANSVNELGFDDGQSYAYQNTKNNRKLLDAVTYDDEGNVIPLSKRFDKRKADARFSRTTATKDAYDTRIDQLFSGEPANRQGVKVLDRSDMLDMLGYGDKPLHLVEGKVVAGQVNHQNVTAEIWKKVPEWIDNPAAVFDSDTVKDRLVFVAPEMVNNKPVLLIVEPNANMNSLNVHVLVNAYDKDSNMPFERWVDNGLARYVDKTKLPIISRSEFQLLRVDNKSGARKILTEKNLNGYLKGKNNSSIGSNQTATNLTKQAATDIISQDADGKRLLSRGKVKVLGSIDEAPDNVQDQITLSDDDGNIQGFYDPVTDTTYLVADALTADTINGVLVHEVGVHAWWAKANSDKKAALEKRAMQLLNQGKRFGNEKIKAFYTGVEQRMIDAGVQGNAEEATAYIVEEAINQAKADRSKLSDSKWIDAIAKWSPSLANFLSDFISSVRASMHRIGWLKTGNLTGADLVAIAKRNMRDVANAKGVENTHSDVSFSKSQRDSLAKFVRDAVTHTKDYTHTIGKTPEFLRSLGVPVMPIKVTSSTIRKAVGLKESVSGRNHNVELDALINLPSEIENPIAVFSTSSKTEKADGGITLVAEIKDKSDNPVVIAIHLNREHGAMQVNLVRSIHGKEDANTQFDKWKEDGKLLFADEERLQQVHGITLIQFQESMNTPFGGNAVDSNSTTSSNGVKFSKGVNSPAAPVTPKFQVPEFTLFRRAQQKFQNNFNRIKQIQDAIIKQGGKVDPTSDVYKAEERFWGKAGSSSAQFEIDVRKLIGDISKSNIDLGDMEDYLYARHAPERNEHIRNNVDANNMAGSGISDDVARGIMANLQTKHKDIDKLADRFDAITKETRVLQYQAGLISKDAFEAWNKYKHYAPLKGFADESLEKEFANSQAGIGRGFDVRGKESKTANGRTTLATALIENIYQQRLQAIVRGGKNEIGAALLNLINDNPNNDLWQIGAIVQSKGSKDGEALLRFDTAQERDKYLDNHGIKGAQLGFDGTSHTARYTAPIGLVKNAIDQGSSTVAVKIGGKEVFIKIKDDALLEQLQRAGIVSDLGMLEPIAQMQNMLKRFYTSLNPEFTAINFMRDLLTAFVAMPKETGNFTDSVKFIKNLSVIGASMRYAYRGRDANMSKGNKDLIDRYLSNGGSTGFMDFQDIEQLGKRVNNMWLDANKAKNANLWDKSKMLSRMAWELTGAQIEKANEGLEIATRLAAFKTAIEAGKTDREAASIAKNITVNFNRKGDYARQADVFMMFFNPAIQGTVRVAELASNPKSATMLAGLVFLGMMMVIASGDEEDEEGNKKWDLLPDENKMKTLPILGLAFDGNFGQIQMPYGINFFTNIGYAMGDVYRHYESNGKHGKSPEEAAEFILKALMLHLNPFGGKQLFEGGLNTVQAVTPAMLDPLIQIGANINWAGKPMRPEDTHNKGKNDATPDSEKFFAGQENNPETKLAQWLSRATGGDGVKSGIFEIAPSSLNAIMSATFGGIWSMGKATHTALSKAANPNEKVELRDIPIARKMIGGVNSGMYSAAYREKADEIKGIMSQYDNYLKDGNLAQAKALRNMNSRVFDGQGSKVDSFDKQLKALRKDRNSIFANKDLSDAQRKKLLTDNKKEVDLILMKAVKDLE